MGLERSSLGWHGERVSQSRVEAGGVTRQKCGRLLAEHMREVGHVHGRRKKQLKTWACMEEKNEIWTVLVHAEP